MMVVAMVIMEAAARQCAWIVANQIWQASMPAFYPIQRVHCCPPPDATIEQIQLVVVATL